MGDENGRFLAGSRAEWKVSERKCVLVGGERRRKLAQNRCLSLKNGVCDSHRCVCVLTLH